MSNIKVTVCCQTYNQEKYIATTLESLVHQNTDFEYEILVHDDASTDATPGIIRMYANKYPELIKPIFQTENQYSQHIKIGTTYLYPIAKGKYITFCEGDDYWCCNDKLQLQYDCMERHPECSICTHYVQPIFEDGTIKKHKKIPLKKIQEGVVSQSQYASWLLGDAACTFQLSSYCVRLSTLKRMSETNPTYCLYAHVGDEKIQRFCLNEGSLYFIPRIMSCYRTNSIGSWTMREHSSLEARKKHMEEMIKLDHEYDVYSDYKFHKYIERGISYREFAFYKQNRDVEMMKNTKFNELWNTFERKKKIKYRILMMLITLKQKISGEGANLV